MNLRIVYHGAILHNGRWFPKVAYVFNEKPGIVEDYSKPCRSMSAAVDAANQVEADLRDKLMEVDQEVEAPPLERK